MTSTTFFIIFIPILAIILLAVNLILAPHNPYQEKDSVFECGFHSFLGQNRTQFSVSFFIFGLLFLLFDLEILLVYPYSVSSYTNDIYGLVIMMVFFVLLTLGFIFELGKNALTIDSRQTSSYNNADTTTPVSFIAKSYSTLKGSSFLSIPVAIINMEPINMEAIIQLTASLFDKCYPLVLALAAIAISILALELGIYLAEPAKDGKEKTGNKVGEGVKNPPKGKKSDNKKPGCVHPSGWCQCNSCGCEETRHIPRMLSDISPDRCCGCGVRGPVNHCLMCECKFHYRCCKNMRGDYNP